MPKPGSDHWTSRRDGQPPAKVWSEVEARRLLEVWNRSGLSLAAYARRLGVGRERLAWWRRRLKMEAQRTSRTQRFVPLIVKPAGAESAAPANLSVEVVLRSGRVMRVGVGRDAGVLSRLIEILETTAC